MVETAMEAEKASSRTKGVVMQARQDSEVTRVTITRSRPSSMFFDKTVEPVRIRLCRPWWGPVCLRLKIALPFRLVRCQGC